MNIEKYSECYKIMSRLSIVSKQPEETVCFDISERFVVVHLGINFVPDVSLKIS